MKNDLISVVLTSYNHKEYLESAIVHILSQTYTNIELIIIDDCSTDGSQEVIQKYVNDFRVKAYLLNENLGSYVKSTNLGASYANGSYINFAQCDDFADPTLLECLYLRLKDNPGCGVAFSASYLIDENDNIIGNDFEGRSRKFKEVCSTDAVIPSSKMRDLLYESCVIPNLSAALVKKELYQSVFGLSDKFLVLADWDMWLRLTHSTDFVYIRTPLNYFRQHSTTIRSRISIRKQINELFLMHKRNVVFSNPSIKERLYIYCCVITIWGNYAIDNVKGWLREFPYLWVSSMRLSLLIPILLPIVAIYKIVEKKIN